MPRIKDLANYTGALNRSDIYFAVDGNSFSRGMSLSGQQVFTMCKGIDGKNIELRATASFIQWRQEGDTSWANLISVSDLKGADGKELEIRIQSGYIQTRLTGGTWANLIAITDLKGDKGDPADNPNFTFVVSALAWDATPTANITGTYPNLTVNLGIPKGKDAANPAFSFIVSALEWNEAPTASVTGTYPDLTVNLGIPKGKDAPLPIFTASSIKGNPDENPDVAVSGSYPNVELQFKIPQGERGLQGKPLVVLSNGNYGNWDEDLQAYVDSGVEASATVDLENVPVAFTEASTRENIQTGETVPTVFGKLKKWFNDLGSLAWKSKVDYSADIDNLPTLITSADVNTAISTHNTSDIAHNDIRADLGNRVEKVDGKGLSTEDYTTEEKQKLAGLESSKFKGEYTMLEELETAWPTADAGSYAFVDAGVGSDTQKYIWDSSDSKWIISGSTGEETPATIKEKYESNPNTNAFTDTEKNKLNELNKSVDKSATIETSYWVEQGDDTYTAIIYDTDILEDSKISLMPADAESIDMYAEAFVFSGASSAGQLLLRAKNMPFEDININYTITI